MVKSSKRQKTKATYLTQNGQHLRNPPDTIGHIGVDEMILFLTCDTAVPGKVPYSRRLGLWKFPNPDPMV